MNKIFAQQITLILKHRWWVILGVFLPLALILLWQGSNITTSVTQETFAWIGLFFLHQPSML